MLVPWALFAAWTIDSWSLWQWQWMKITCGTFIFSRAWTPVHFAQALLHNQHPCQQACDIVHASSWAIYVEQFSVSFLQSENSHELFNRWSIFHPKTKMSEFFYCSNISTLGSHYTEKMEHLEVDILASHHPYCDILHEISDGIWWGIGCILCCSTRSFPPHEGTKLISLANVSCEECAVCTGQEYSKEKTWKHFGSYFSRDPEHIVNDVRWIFHF